MLGTGHAMVTKCYNTCFLIKNDKGSVMIDCGGGNKLLNQMDGAGEDWRDVKDIFITHAHTDHVTGIVWAVRRLSGLFRDGSKEDVNIYGHSEVIELVRTMLTVMLSKYDGNYDFAGGHIHLVTVEDGDTFTSCGMEFTAFDIGSEDKKQFGFRCQYRPGEYIVCLGDESYHDTAEKYARDADWLMHEAFNAEPSGGIQRHGSARRAGQNARLLGAKHLIMYHTEDRNLAERKALYTSIAAQEYDGEIFMPDDLETIDL